MSAVAAQPLPVGAAGLEGCVTTPAEHSAIDAFHKAMADRRERRGKPTIEDMLAQIDTECAAREAAVRVSIMSYGAPSNTALDAAINLDAAHRFLEMCSAADMRDAIKGVLKKREEDKARRARFAAAKKGGEP